MRENRGKIKMANRKNDDITSESVTKELKRHNEWKETNKLSATPTILVNGYQLPEHYQIEDMAEFVDSAINN